MPAIRYLTGYQSSRVRSHYNNNYFCSLELINSSGQTNHASCVGFICTQGARFLTGANLGRVKVLAFTNGEGKEENEWRQLRVGESIYCMVLPSKGNPPFICYVLIDDNGWPILTGDHPYNYMPANPDFVSPVAYQNSGKSPIAK